MVTIPPRREPQSSKPDASLALKENEKEEESEEETDQSVEPNEFDFDSQAVDAVKRYRCILLNTNRIKNSSIKLH